MITKTVRNGSRALAVLTALAVITPVSPALAQVRDTTPPTLVSFDFTPKAVDIANRSATVVATMRITDESGLSETDPSLVFYSDTTTQNTGFCSTQLTSGTRQDGIYSATCAIPRTAATGTWTASLFPLSDTIGNSQNSFGPGAGFPRTLTVTADGTSGPVTPQPVVLTQEASADLVLLTASGRPGAEVQIYARRVGDTEWTQIGYETLNSSGTSRPFPFPNIGAPGSTFEVYAHEYVAGGAPGPVGPTITVVRPEPQQPTTPPVAPTTPTTPPTATPTPTRTAQATPPVVMASASRITLGTTVDITVSGEPGESVAMIWNGPSTDGERTVHASILGQNGEVTFTTRPPVAGVWTILAQTANGRSNPIQVKVVDDRNPAAVAPTTTLLRGAQEINLGQVAELQVSGTPGSIVDLYAYSRPNITYRLVRSGTLDNNGNAYFGVRPGGDTRMYARVRNGPVGNSVVIGVRYYVSFAGKPQSNGTVNFVGTVVPRRPGVPVAIYRGLGDGTRQVVGRGTTNSNGQYSVPVRFSTSGTMFFLATAGGTSANRQGISSAIAVPVRQYAAPAPDRTVTVAPRPAAPAPSRPASPVVRPPSGRPGTYYANCDAVRRAGQAPLFRGEFGYRPALDRDNDGVACE